MLYQNLVDHVAAGDAGKKIGKRVVLSSSFVGGNRDLHRRYQDAMAVVRAHGKPSFFITFTCNPNWPEIVNSLPKGLKACDRPDIVSRVFRQKLNELLTDIKENAIFGTANANLSVTEFQKRGLPHGHILCILDSQFRLTCADEIDDTVLAEIPPLPVGPRPNDDEQAKAYDQAVRLHEAVLEHMVHNDCTRNRGAPCLSKEGFCTKGFPKPFHAATTFSEMEIYPEYRRRPPEVGAPPVIHKGRVVDNRWVVPYSPYLLLKYDAHINVEVCCSVSSVKYLYKYVYKGPDRAMTCVCGENDAIDVDEIQNFQDARCIGACEACWRIFEFHLYERSPPVEALCVHLPNEHQTLLAEGGSEAEIARRQERAAALPAKTMLTDYFRYVVAGGGDDDDDDDAPWKRLTYSDFASYYRYDRNSGWQLRVRCRPDDVGVNPQNVTVSRVHYKHPSAGEVFYLRLLLCKVAGEEIRDTARRCGCDGFEALKAGAATYKEACEARGLLATDREWDNTLHDAASMQMPRQMRDLFVTLLVFNHPTDPTTLFETHFRAMGDDMLDVALGRQHTNGGMRQRRPDELTVSQQQRLRALVLADLEKMLLGYGQVGEVQLRELPRLTDEERSFVTQSADSGVSQLVLNELRYDTGEQQQLFDERFQNVSKVPSQGKLVGTVIDALDNNQPLAVFADAPGGGGKTYCFNTLLSYVRKQGDVALAVASTGIAAILLEGGRTLHSSFRGAPLKPTANDPTWIDPKSERATLIRRARLIVWDEAPMNHRYLLEGLDRTLRDIMAAPGQDPSRLPPFGGKVIVIGGDFRQVLPVMRLASRAQVVDSCLKRSPLWRAFTVFHLTDNMRVLTADPRGTERSRLSRFSRFLLALGSNNKSEMRECLDTDYGSTPASPSSSSDSTVDPDSPDIEMPAGLCVDGGREALIDWTFDELERHLGDADFFEKRAILAPRHCEVHEINQSVLERVDSTSWEKTSIDELALDETAPIPTEFLNSLTDGGLPPHVLNIKRGVPVMLLRNLRVDEGLCNGTRLLVTDFTPSGLMVAKIITGPKRGNTVLVPRIKLYAEQGKWPFTWHRTQASRHNARVDRHPPARGWHLHHHSANALPPCVTVSGPARLRPHHQQGAGTDVGSRRRLPRHAVLCAWAALRRRVARRASRQHPVRHPSPCGRASRHRQRRVSRGALRCSGCVLLPER